MWLVKLLSKDGDLSLFLPPPTTSRTLLTCVWTTTNCVWSQWKATMCAYVGGGYALLAYPTWSTDNPIYRHREYLLNNSFASFQQRTFSGICTLKRDIFNVQNGNSRWLWTFCISHFTHRHALPFRILPTPVGVRVSRINARLRLASITSN